MAIGTIGADLTQFQRQARPANPLESLIQGFTQGTTAAQLPEQLQDQALARQLNNMILQQKINDLQNPNAALARKVQEQLAIRGLTNPKSGIEMAPEGLVGETIASPGTVTEEQSNALGLPQARGAFVAPQEDITPIAVGGSQTGFNLNPQAIQDTKNFDTQRKIQEMQAKAAAMGVPGKTIVDSNGNLQFVPSRQFGDSSPIATSVKNQEGQQVVAAPTGKSSGISGNEQTKLTREGAQVGVPYDSSLYGDISRTENYAKYQDAVKAGQEAQGAVTDPKLKTLAVRSQVGFNREPVVQTKKNLEIFGKEAADAIQHIIDHPDEPAGARQIEAFDSFIKAFSAGKPTVAQYGQIQQYQSVENLLSNLPARLTSGQRLTNEELQTYADAIKSASQALDAPYRDKVQQYRDEMVAYGISPKAAEKIIKSENGGKEKVQSNQPQNPSIPEGMKLQRNKVTGETRLVPK